MHVRQRSVTLAYVVSGLRSSRAEAAVDPGSDLLRLGNAVASSSMAKPSLGAGPPSPRSMDLTVLCMQAMVAAEGYWSSCLICSCLALAKYSLADLYLPCFKDAPTALTSRGLKGRGLSCHAEAILHHVFHNEARGCLLVLAYSSCSNRSNALLRLYGVLAASKACCWLPRPCAAYVIGESGLRKAGAGSLSSKAGGVKWHALLQLCMMLCLSSSAI